MKDTATIKGAETLGTAGRPKVLAFLPHSKHRHSSTDNAVLLPSKPLVSDIHGTNKKLASGYCYSCALRPLGSTKAETILANTLTTSVDPASAGTFEPILNVPALGSFLFIAFVFGLLQWRVRSIETAAVERTRALHRLRELKRQELEGSGTDSKIVREALEQYRQAVLRVERLRTVIPGIARIVQPPSQSLTRERMDENVAAAKQFLDMDLLEQNNNKSDGDAGEMSLGLKLLIGVVVTLQIGVLLALSVDPLSMIGGSQSIAPGL